MRESSSLLKRMDTRFRGYDGKSQVSESPAGLPELREKPRPYFGFAQYRSGRGWIARRTKFAFFLCRIVRKHFLDQIGQIAPVQYSEFPQSLFQFLVDFHVQNFASHVESNNLYC